jgi:hypothetical protein
VVTATNPYTISMSMSGYLTRRDDIKSAGERRTRIKHTARPVEMPFLRKNDAVGESYSGLIFLYLQRFGTAGAIIHWDVRNMSILEKLLLHSNIMYKRMKERRAGITYHHVGQFKISF